MLTKAFKTKRRPCTFGQSLWYTNCPVNFSFFWSTKFFFGIPNFFLVDQIFFWSTKFLFGIPKLYFVNQIVFGWPKKWEIDRTIDIPKRLTPLLRAYCPCWYTVIAGLEVTISFHFLLLLLWPSMLPMFPIRVWWLLHIFKVNFSSTKT